MAAVTLLEQAKTMTEPKAAGIVGTYASAYHPMTVMPLKPAPTGVYKWNLENELPYTTGGVRNYNGTWTRTYGKNTPMSSTTKIYGGSFQIDRQLAKINPDGVSDQKAKQIKADARVFTKDVFEGAGGTAIWGIDHYIDNVAQFANQGSNVGTSTTAAVLLTDHLDKLLSLIDRRAGMTFIYCTDTIGLRIRKLSRGNNVTSDIGFANRFTPMQWGFFDGVYDGVPVIVLKDGKGADLLTKTRATSADGSHVYAVTYGEDAFTGFQVNGMEVVPLKDDTVYDFFDFEWPVGTAAESIRSIARLNFVKEEV